MRDDDLWLEKYNLAKEYFEVNGSLEMPVDYTVNGVNLYRWLTSQKRQYKIGNLSKKRIELLNKLNIIWMVRTYSWEYKYNLVKRYYDEKGDLLIPHSYEIAIDGEAIKLGNWLHNQRSFYKKGRLPQNRIKLLEDIGMKWDNVNRDILDRKWLIMYKEALKYYEENGNLVVPYGYNIIIDKKEYSLRRWIHTQKDYFVNNELSEDKKKRFVKLMNLCNMTSVSDLNFLKYYSVCKMYYETNGDLNVPYNYEVTVNGEVIKLGQWINLQRKKYKSGNLSKEKILLLENIKMLWKFHNKYLLDENLENVVESRNLLKWTRMYDLAKVYYQNNGNLLIPHSYEITIDGEIIKLGNWLHNQRSFYKKGRLPQNRIILLEEIGMKWNNVNRDILDRKWLIMYKEALKYYNENGNLVIPNGYNITIDEKECSLRKWIHTQKDYFVNNKLSEDKKEFFIKLMNLSDITCVYDLKFMKYYSLCKEYYEKHGDLRVPFNYEVTVNGEVIKLGQWINSQRMSYKGKRAELSDERIKMLDELGMIWEFSSIKEKEWIRKYELLKTYYDTNGDLFVPYNYTVDGVNLDKWLIHQIKLYKNGKLPEERIKMLNDIGVIWILDYKIAIKWERKYQLAKEYYEKNGNLQVPFDYVINENNEEIKLGRWLARQIELYHCNRLSLEKINVLSKLGIDWEVKEKKLKYN